MRSSQIGIYLSKVPAVFKKKGGDKGYAVKGPSTVKGGELEVLSVEIEFARSAHKCYINTGEQPEKR